MKTFRFVFFVTITLAFGIVLNSKMGSIPPLGKFLSPFRGFWTNAEEPGVNYTETLKIDGLDNEVKVYYDELRIPHIYADNETDLHTVQGYITARDRLWQMDFFSRLVLGRLSEVLDNPAVLNYDKYNRRIGLKRMTYEFYEKTKSSPELHAVIQAYSNGVNAYIDQMSSSDLPLEFKLLNYKPERWSPVKTCLAYAMLSNTLSRGESDLENTNALMLFGRELFDILYPEQLGNIDPVIRKTRKWNFSPVPVVKPDIPYPQILTESTTEKPHPLNGSNNFAVSGAKTKSGNVLLANEPDLELTSPSIWYAYHLNDGHKNVMGVTVPGTPIILIGFNDSISWGVTNSPRDQVDWYAIEFRDDSRKEYLFNNNWFKTEQVIEEFQLADGSTAYDTIIYTHHGPVVYDRNFRGDNQKSNYAMKWIAHFPSTTFDAMYEINQASNYDEFENAMKKFQGPPQNFIFGSAQGDIALWLPGKFPVKWEEQGKFLMDGSELSHEWKQYIPFDHYMYDLNPEQNYLTSANQHQVDSLYPYYVYDHNYEYYRGRRINDRLRVLDDILPKDMMRLQNDNYNYMASESLPMMLSALDTARFDNNQWTIYKTLAEWDYFNAPNLKAPTVYQLWWDLLYKNTWDEFDTISVEVNKPHRYVTIDRFKNDSTFAFADILETPTRESTSELMALTFDMALDSLDAWVDANGEDYSWYRFKNTTIKHLLRLDPFSTSEVPVGGYSGIVNAASKGHGPSWRMVVELDPNGTKAWGVYPGSQTGNPGSPLYGQMIENWATGNYYQLLFDREVDGDEKVIFTQTIEPK
ncbi:penicillin acylase family protein [Marinoscillum sp.]|uniref:penicillin acylase family protein n=1 Tax=Marinoscillum sp. TaxID=2024838 RepID=UPI003BAB196D